MSRAARRKSRLQPATSPRSPREAPRVPVARRHPQLAAVATCLFLSGTANNITPISAVDGRPVGSGTPGPITARLREALDARLYGRSG